MDDSTESEQQDDQAITQFLCHKLDKQKARQTVARLADSVEGEHPQALIRELPIVLTPGVQQNRLVACSGDKRIFVMNMKTGESWEWKEWM